MEPLIQQKKTSFLNKRLLQLIQEKSLNLNMLSQKAGIPVESIQNMINDPAYDPSIDSIQSICKALDIPISYLIEQHQRIDHLAKANIPLLNWHTLADNVKNSASTFALTMTESSTIFPVGTALVFDKQKPYYNGCYVLVQLDPIKQYVLKKLIIDESNLYIKSIDLDSQENTLAPSKKIKSWPP